MVHNLTVSIARRCGLFWADLVYWVGFLVSKTSSLWDILSNLASYAMDVSIEWRPLFEEIQFALLDFSGVGSIGGFFLLGLHIFFTLHVHLLSRISLGSWFLGESCFDNLDHHREFDIVATSLRHNEGIGQEGL